MNGIPQDEFDGYNCNVFYDSNNDRTVKRGSFDSMNEGWDDEGNGEEEQEWGENENGGNISHISSKGRCAWRGVECELVDDVGLFVVSGHIIACDPREAVLDN